MKNKPLNEQEHRELAQDICAAARLLRNVFFKKLNGRYQKSDRLRRELYKVVSPSALGRLKMAGEDAACRDLGTDLGMAIWGQAIKGALGE